MKQVVIDHKLDGIVDTSEFLNENGVFNLNLNQINKRSIDKWSVKASIVAKNTFNPIRNILETMDITPNPLKKMISLSIGDPTVFGNLKPSKEIIEAVKASLEAGTNNGYGPSTGFAAAREAVAKHVSVPGGQVTADDIILCSGCSCALDIAISTMANAGQNILVPRPGFPLYTTLAAGLGTWILYYKILFLGSNFFMSSALTSWLTMTITFVLLHCKVFMCRLVCFNTIHQSKMKRK